MVWGLGVLPWTRVDREFRFMMQKGKAYDMFISVAWLLRGDTSQTPLSGPTCSSLVGI